MHVGKNGGNIECLRNKDFQWQLLFCSGRRLIGDGRCCGSRVNALLVRVAIVVLRALWLLGALRPARRLVIITPDLLCKSTPEGLVELPS